MRIGIDNISPGESTGRDGPGGMRTYLQSMVREFSLLAPQHEFVVITPDWAEPLIEDPPPNVSFSRLSGVPAHRASRTLYQQSALPLALSRQKLNVFFATATVAPLLGNTPIVLAVQFIQFYLWSNAYGRLRTAYLKRLLPASLRKASRAIIFTKSAKEDLVRWTGVSPDKVAVIPHGLPYHFSRSLEGASSTSEFSARAKLTAGRPYILYVSATYGYKNHLRLIEAFALLKRRLRLPHALLLVGSTIDVTSDQLHDAARAAGVSEEVVLAGRLESTGDLVSVYEGADVTVVPTLYETFGYPALEAMACGCPLVASDIGSMIEVCGDAAVLVDPSTTDDIARGMEQVLTDNELRQRLVEAGRVRAREYSWRRSAAATLRILEDVGESACAS